MGQIQERLERVGMLLKRCGSRKSTEKTITSTSQELSERALSPKPIATETSWDADWEILQRFSEIRNAEQTDTQRS